MLPKTGNKYFYCLLFTVLQICRRWRMCTFTCEYLRKFLKKIEITLLLFSGAWGKMIHEKNLKQKSCVTAALRQNLSFFSVKFHYSFFDFKKHCPYSKCWRKAMESGHLPLCLLLTIEIFCWQNCLVWGIFWCFSS